MSNLNTNGFLTNLRNRAKNLITSRTSTVTLTDNADSVAPTPATRPHIIQAESVTLMVNNFSPIINLSPSLDITTPDVTVNVAAPTVTVEAPNVTVEPPQVSITNQVDVKVPELPSPTISNQITVTPSDIKEVNVALAVPPNMLPDSGSHHPKEKKTITIQGPNGKYVGTVEEK